ncbi:MULTISPECIES: hypothetical protein [unclassified Streptomyces]|uniref:hypothetical protein n=1 Tax=unclassified Streptomyces TaxID=2593676 RepID=UPI002256E6A0|nr:MULTISPECIES: hypothetical protein [unclassified Streptomyces]MCX4404606.1 hypothetical protein [Streptomyces sp. NBC_01764]MCX5190851.1 hypothetical protein [Streptomyces sp. NBC_00268]
MVADELLLLVPGPVGVEVAVGADGAQFEYGFGAGEAPTGAGDVQAVFGQVAACSLDDAGGDRPAASQSGVVAQVFGLAGQVVHGVVDALALGAAQSCGSGGRLERGGGLLNATGQEGAGVAGGPCFGGGVAGVVQAPGRSPQIFEHVDQVDDDVDVRDRVLGNHFVCPLVMCSGFVGP